jgi:hypothetical protein
MHSYKMADYDTVADRRSGLQKIMMKSVMYLRRICVILIANVLVQTCYALSPLKMLQRGPSLEQKRTEGYVIVSKFTAV